MSSRRREEESDATCNNGRIDKLSLTNLSLRGSISPVITNCTNLQPLNLSFNFLAGPIPSDLQYLVNLAVLNLSSNQLSGPIPPQLILCAYLNVIDLHDNSLTGPILQQLGLLVRLSAFDVSNNKLASPILGSLGNRSGNLPRFNATSFQWNKELYGYLCRRWKAKGFRIGKWVRELGAQLYRRLHLVENYKAEDGAGSVGDLREKNLERERRR